MGGIPTVAISNVNISRNIGIMNDQILMDRLTLIPIRASIEDVNDIIIKLDTSTMPRDKIRDIYSSDLNLDSNKVFIPYSDILITRLLSNHEIKLTATCSVGLGNEHARYSPSIYP